MATSETTICNQALGRIGAKRINNLTDGSEEAIHCTLHYEQTRDALLRSFWWRFAAGRATLSQDATDPDFEWDNQFDLPTDFMAFRTVFEDNNVPSKTTMRRYELEGLKLLTNEDEMEIRYVKKITDPAKFDPLFVELLVLQLALKLVMPLSEDKTLRREIRDDIVIATRKVRALDRQETNTRGRLGETTWVDVRTGSGRIPSRL